MKAGALFFGGILLVIWGIDQDPQPVGEIIVLGMISFAAGVYYMTTGGE